MKTVPIVSALLLIMLPTVTLAQAVSEPGTPPVTFSLIDTGHGLTLHKEMYFLPVTYANEYDGKQMEVVYQLSAKHDLFRTGFFFAYNQISFWQAYDNANSSPFRDTNYNPEIFFRFTERRWQHGLVGADAGFEHESNGQLVPHSRSWNLLYLAPSYHRDNWLIYAKVRYRIPEEEKETPDSALGDDNPDITDYLGYTDIHAYYMLPRKQLLHLLVRGFVGTDKGNVSLNYSIPVRGAEDGYVCVRFFHGYGESLMDYNRSVTRIGIGIMFNR